MLWWCYTIGVVRDDKSVVARHRYLVMVELLDGLSK